MKVYGVFQGKKKNISKRIIVKSDVLRIKLESNMIKTKALSPRIKINKMYWYFRKGDADFNPSVPHGHSIEGNYKLELWTGNIIDERTKQVIKQARIKDMLELYNFPGFLDFVEECRKDYCDLHPGFKLKPLIYPEGIMKVSRRINYNKKYRYDGIIVEIDVLPI